jgi:hypothetical protein
MPLKRESREWRPGDRTVSVNERFSSVKLSIRKKSVSSSQKTQTNRRDPLQPEGERGASGSGAPASAPAERSADSDEGPVGSGPPGPPEGARTHAVVLYANAFSKEPVLAAELEWRELTEELETLAARTTKAAPAETHKRQKLALPAWSPVLLSAPYCAAENVTHVSLLAIDVDDRPVVPVLDRLAENGWAAFVCASPSDDPGKPDARRFRVVSPTTRNMSPDECGEMRKRFAEALGLDVESGVAGALDPSRIWFIGRLHDTAERDAVTLEGKPVDPDALPAPVLAWGSGKAAAAGLTPLSELPPADAGIAAALGDWRAHQGRKWDLCGAVGGVMRKEGYSAAQAEAELREWLMGAAAEGVDVDAGVAWALAAWQLKPEKVSGYHTVAELLGDAHAQVVADAAWSGSLDCRMLPAWLRAPGRPANRDAAPENRADGWAGPVSGKDPLGTRLLQSVPREPLEYYCEGLMLAKSRGKISLIAGLPGAGKGPLADHLAVCFATGSKAFGKFPCRTLRVLLLDSEGAELTMDRCRRSAEAMGIDPIALDANLDVRDATETYPDDHLADAIKASGVEVVIVDSYTSMMLETGLDSFKPEFALFAKSLARLGVLVILLAHANKSIESGERPTLGAIAGSFALAAMAQTGIAVWHPDAENDNIVRVACMRGPFGGFPGFDVEFRGSKADPLHVKIVDTEAIAAKDASVAKNEPRSRIANALLDYLRQSAGFPKTAKPMFESLGLPRHTDRDPAFVLNALVDAGYVLRTTHKRNDEYTILQAPDVVEFDGDTVRAAGPAGAASVGGFRR